MTNENFEPKIVGFLLQLVLVPGGRPGRHGPHQVSAQRPHHPRDVQRAGRSQLRAQGPGLRGRRRDDRRLPPGRMPLHRAELQGHAPLLDAQAHADGDGRRAGSRPTGLGLGGRRAATGRGHRPSWSTTFAGSVRSNGRPTGRRTASARRGPGRRSLKEHEEAMEVLPHESSELQKAAKRASWPSTGPPPAAAAKSPSWQIDAKILDVAAAFDLVFCPCIADGKVRDIEKMADGEIDVCLFNGGIRTSEQEYMAQLMRRKSKVLVAFGSCASEGCIPGLAQPERPQVDLRHGLQGRLGHRAGQPAGRSPAARDGNARGHAHLPVFYDTLEDAGPDGRRGLLSCPAARRRPRTSGRPSRPSSRASCRRRARPSASIRPSATSASGSGTRRRSRSSTAPGRSFPTRRPACWSRACCAAASPPGPAAGPCVRGQLALHRLPRPQRGRGRLRRPADERRGLGDRLQRPERKSTASSPKAFPIPVGTFYRFSLASSLLRRKKTGMATAIMKEIENSN